MLCLRRLPATFIEVLVPLAAEGWGFEELFFRLEEILEDDAVEAAKTGFAIAQSLLKKPLYNAYH
jgi:hypothetical protein